MNEILQLLKKHGERLDTEIAEATVAIVILEVFAKTTSQTPQSVIDVCNARLKHYKSI
ncbi:MAG: hypothetical protein Q7J38_00030 [Gallionella sp.]|nr:hypothetical protein [Gallionella sp.]